MFKFAAFYGVSAPMMLMFTEREIKAITSLQLTTPAAHLLSSLRYECMKLDEILNDPESINLEVDDDSMTAKYFIAGLNKSLADRNESTAAPAEPSKPESKTSLFDTTPATDDLGIGLMDLSLPEDDLGSLLSDIELETWHLSPDLIALGREVGADYTGRITNIATLKRFVAFQCTRELDAEDAKSLQEQFKQLPMRPSERVVVWGKVIMLKEEHPELFEVLQSLYRQANTPVDGKPKIKFIVESISECLTQSSAMTAKFFGIHFDSLKRISSIYSCNRYVNESIVKGPLSTASRDSKVAIVSSLIDDCDVLLGTRTTGSSLDLTAKPYNLELGDATSSVNLTDLARQIIAIPAMRETGIGDYESSLAAVLEILKDMPSSDKALCNSDELVLLTYLHHRLSELDNGGMVAALGLQNAVSDPEALNDVGILAAKVLRIGGIYAGYMHTFRDTLNITDRAVRRTTFKLEPHSAIELNDIYYNIKLVRRHLLSVKARYS